MTKSMIGAALLGSLLLSAPVDAQTHAATHSGLVAGTCGPLSHTAEGPLGSDLTKRQSRFYCDAAIISTIGDYPGHILVQFAEKESYHDPQLGFGGRLESEDLMQVEHVYLQSGVKNTVSDGACKFFLSDDRQNLTGIACGMKLDEAGRRTTAIVSFEADR